MSRWPKGWLAFHVWILLLCTLAAGCGVTTHFDRSFSLPHSTQERRIPVRAGLYLEPEFRSFVLTGQPPMKHRVEMSDTLGRLTEQLCRTLFQDLRILTNDHLIRPEVVDVSCIVRAELTYSSLYWTEQAFKPVQYHALFGLKWIVTDKAGNTLYMEEHRGGGASSKAFLQFDKRANEAVSNALRDVFAKSRDGLAATEWWSRLL